MSRAECIILRCKCLPLAAAGRLRVSQSPRVWVENLLRWLEAKDLMSRNTSEKRKNIGIVKCFNGHQNNCCSNGRCMCTSLKCVYQMYQLL